MDLRQRQREVLAINRAIAGAGEVEEILRLVVDRTAGFTGATACLLLLDRGDGLARVARSTGLDPRRAEGLALPLDERIVEALAERLAIPAADTFVGVPVIGAAGLRGVLAVYLAGPASSDGAVDTETLSAFADQAAIALDGAERTRALRASEARFRAMADGAPVLIWMAGLDKGCTWFNRPWLDFTGRTMAQEQGNGWAAGVHPDDLARCLEIYTGHFDRREPFSMEYRLRRHDGEYRWLIDTGLPMRDQAGTFTGYIGSCIDLSDRRRVEQALGAAHLELNRHVTNTPLALIEWDGDYRVIRFSARAEAMFGWRADEVLGRRIDEVPWVPEEDWPKVRAVMRDMDSGVRPSNVNLNRNRCKDGSLIHCEWYNSSLAGPDGKLGSVFSLVQDVTDREVARAALKESEAHFRLLVQSAPVAMAYVHHDTGAMEINAALTAVSGYTREEVPTAEAWFSRAYPDEAYRRHVIQDWSEGLDRARGEDGMVAPREYRVTAKDGKVLTVQISGVPVGLDQLAVMVDLTAIRAMQEQLAIASRLAAMGTLVAGVAHEINNPLSVVMGNHAVALESVEKLLGGLRAGTPLDRGAVLRLLDEVEVELRESEAGGQRIQRIVKDLTTLGRPDAKRTRVRLAEVMAGAMRWLPGHVRLTAEIRVEDRGAPDILAAGGQIEQVLVNLITNAVKATPPGRPAVVRVELGPGRQGMARLEVVDRGHGIDAALLGRIFDPFFTTREVGQGTGLGLSVCHAIVTAYGGIIEVESAVGQGSTFRVELPVAPASLE